MAEEEQLPALKPKGLPLVDRAPKRTKNDGIKEIAVKLIGEALSDEKLKQAKIMKKVDRSFVPARAVWEAFTAFEKALGGREALIRTLEHCPPNSNAMSMMTKLLNDPDFLDYTKTKGDDENTRYSLAAICTRHRIPFNAVVAAFRDSKTAQIALESLHTISTNTPKVVEQLAADSQNRYDPCDTCEGTGRIWRIGEDGEFVLDDKGEHLTQICHGGCRGTGRVFVKHDVQNRKMFLQIAGVIAANEGKGTAVNVYNQTAQVFKSDFLPGDGSFEKLLKAVDVVSSQSNQRPQLTGDEVIDVVPNTIYEEENGQ